MSVTGSTDTYADTTTPADPTTDQPTRHGVAERDRLAWETTTSRGVPPPPPPAPADPPSAPTR